MNNGHWQYPIEIDAQEWFGFVYRIIELNTGREYIGKKQLKMYTKKKIKDRKNRKTVIKESAWRKYTVAPQNSMPESKNMEWQTIAS